VHKIQEVFQHKRYCTVTFIDISQAFDKVWDPGLLYKLKRTLPHRLYSILKSYLTNRVFQVRYQSEYSSLYNLQSGVRQGSILDPYYIPSSLQTYPTLIKHSLPLMQTIQQYWLPIPIPSPHSALPTTSGETRTLAKKMADTRKRIQIHPYHIHTAKWCLPSCLSKWENRPPPKKQSNTWEFTWTVG